MHQDVELSAARAWAVLGERFGDLSWSTGITSSSLEGELSPGAIRVCRFPPNMFSKAGEVRERLLHYDPDARSLAYEATDLPGIMRKAINRWTISPRDAERCRIASHATVELRGPMVLLQPLMRVMLRRMGARFIDELVAHARTVQDPLAYAAQ